MKNIKSGYLIVLLFFAAQQWVCAQQNVQSSILHPKGLLWKIEKQGMPVSYLFGTMHVSDSRVTKLPEIVDQVFLRADHFVMEVVMDQRGVDYLSEVSFFNNGQSLKKIMGSTEYEKLLKLSAKRIFIPEHRLNRMKPWAVLMLLMSPLEAQPEAGGLLDMVLYQKALHQKLNVSGLESVEEQISVFDSMSLADQLWLLSRSIDDIDLLDAQFPEMLNAYLNRDLAGLVNIQKAAMYDDSQIDDRFIHRLLTLRNIRMVERINVILQQRQTVFVAIGALHLPGKAGVLHLLEQQGYRVTRAY